LVFSSNGSDHAGSGTRFRIKNFEYAGFGFSKFKTLTDAAALEKGKSAFVQNCAACHGQSAEGKIGPNLTNEYWLHGGEVNEIFKTIKFG